MLLINFFSVSSYISASISATSNGCPVCLQSHGKAVEHRSWM